MKKQPEYEVVDQLGAIITKGFGPIDQLATYVKALASMGFKLRHKYRSPEERSANWIGHQIHVHLRNADNRPFATIGLVAGRDLAITATVCLPGDQFSREEARDRISYQFRSSSLSCAIPLALLQDTALDTKIPLTRRLITYVTHHTRLDVEDALSQTVYHEGRRSRRMDDYTRPTIIGHMMSDWLSKNDEAVRGMAGAAILLHKEAQDAEEF